MRILFLHQNFPGQFMHAAAALHRSGKHDVRAISCRTDNLGHDLVPTERYKFTNEEVGRGHPLWENYILRVARGARATEAMQKLKSQGFEPDVVVGHPGWGETIFVKDVWPKTRTIIHAEWYYRHANSDTDFDPEFQNPKLANLMRIRGLNGQILLALADADQMVAPTTWQASRFPERFRKDISIVHEGIDTDYIKPEPKSYLTLASGPTLRPGDEVVTFVSRQLEPYRGFHTFMRALPDILRARPKARALIIGSDGVGYGPAAPKGKTWRQVYLEEMKGRLPLDRVHFLGHMPHNRFLYAMQFSAAHVYLTYPFVLSWSMIEAMGAGALLIGSKTAPVEEVIQDGDNGLLVPFFDRQALTDRVVDALANQGSYQEMRRRARQTVVERYDLKSVCLPAWLRLIEGDARP